ALSSYVRGMLTSAAIMRGVGVGQQAATPLAAVFTFFLRDLAGMLGGIVFAFLEGSSFDSCAKQWRLFADITNDLGMTMELASPLLPRAMFLPIACFGSIARSVTGVAGGATRAALTQHFALRNNAADVSAKEQSQETATTILGMVAGMAVTRLAADSAAAAWLVFGSLTAVHVAANVAALRRLLLASLNQPRLELLVARYLEDGTVLGPRAVAEEEDLTPPPLRRLLDWASGAEARRPVQLRYGSRLTAALPAAALAQLLTRQGRRRYLLLPGAGGKPGSQPQPLQPSKPSKLQPHVVLHVVLHRQVTAADQLRAFVHARCLQRELTRRWGTLQQPEQQQGQASSSPPWFAAAELAAEEWMAARFEPLLVQLRAAGWQAERVALPRPAWTAEWEPPGGGLHSD
ncbi:hypothetical protein TSOC_011118, partial [Tetrabaena socialis]